MKRIFFLLFYVVNVFIGGDRLVGNIHHFDGIIEHFESNQRSVLWTVRKSVCCRQGILLAEKDILNWNNLEIVIKREKGKES